MRRRSYLATACLVVSMVTFLVFTVSKANSVILENLYKVTGDDVIGRRGQVLTVKSTGVCSMT